MAQLDRFLNLLVTNNATELNLSEGDVASVKIKDSARPVMKQPLTAAQIMTLVREIAPANAPRAYDVPGGVQFEYASADGTFEVVVTQNGKISARIAPKSQTPNVARPAAPPMPSELAAQANLSAAVRTPLAQPAVAVAPPVEILR